jgi:hypothetical protein
MVGLVLNLQALQLEHRVNGHEDVVVLCGDTVRVSDFAKPALDFNDLWKSSTFYRFW